MKLKNTIFLIVLAIILFFVIRMYEPPLKVAYKSQAAASASPSIDLYFIKKTVKEFTNDFNEKSKHAGLAFGIKEIKVEAENNHKSFVVPLNDQLSLIGIINQADDSLRSVVVIGQSDGSPQADREYHTLIDTLIAITNPKMGQSDRDQVMKELGLSGNAQPKDIQGDAVRGGIQYSVSSNGTIGLMFSISREHDNLQ